MTRQLTPFLVFLVCFVSATNLLRAKFPSNHFMLGAVESHRITHCGFLGSCYLVVLSNHVCFQLNPQLLQLLVQ